MSLQNGVPICGRERVYQAIRQLLRESTDSADLLLHVEQQEFCRILGEEIWEKGADYRCRLLLYLREERMAEKNVACYIINTGDFMGKKVQKEDTLGILEAVVEGKAQFKPWGPFSDIEIMEWDGFVPDLTDKGYVAQMQARMQDRLNYVEGLKDAEGGFNMLPTDAAEAIRKVVDQANSL